VTTPVEFWRCLGLILSASGDAIWPSEIPICGNNKAIGRRGHRIRRGIVAPEVAWSLVDAGFKVIAFSRRGRRGALHHSHHVAILDIAAPEKDCAAALEELAAVLDSQHARHMVQSVLLPLDDASQWLCSLVQTRFKMDPSWRQPPSCRVGNRQAKADTGGHGGRVPSSADVVCRHRGRTLVDCVGDYPIILRPVHAVTVSEGGVRKGRNWISSDEAELYRARSVWNGSELLMLQSFLEGTGEGVFGLATDQGVVAWSAHRGLRMMNPHGSGSSACISQEVPDDLKRPVAASVKSCDWRGMFMMELLRTEDKRLWFFEFNGRA